MCCIYTYNTYLYGVVNLASPSRSFTREISLILIQVSYFQSRGEVEYGISYFFVCKVHLETIIFSVTVFRTWIVEEEVCIIRCSCYPFHVCGIIHFTSVNRVRAYTGPWAQCNIQSFCNVLKFHIIWEDNLPCYRPLPVSLVWSITISQRDAQKI